jgi:hypothetical protein
MKEIWKNIKDYEGLYQVSNLGNIKSNKRKGTNGIITKQLSKIGYYIVDLYKNSKRETKYLHRIIAETFISNPNNFPCINHKNGIKTDNRIDNLEWCSYSENNKHAYSLGLKTNCKQIKQIDIKTNKTIKTFYSMNEASRQIHISQSSISLCCNGKQKTAGGYIWKYY